MYIADNNIVFVY